MDASQDGFEPRVSRSGSMIVNGVFKVLDKRFACWSPTRSKVLAASVPSAGSLREWSPLVQMSGSEIRTG